MKPHFYVHVIDHGLNVLIDPAGPTAIGFRYGAPPPGAVPALRMSTFPLGFDFDGETLTLDAFGLLRLREWLKAQPRRHQRLRELVDDLGCRNDVLRALDLTLAGAPYDTGDRFMRNQVERELRTAHHVLTTGPLGPAIRARLTTLQDGGQDEGARRAVDLNC